MNRIKDARVKMGISQKELAGKAGVDPRTLRKIEKGEYVSEVSQAAVEKALGLSSCNGLGYPTTYTAAMMKPFWPVLTAAIAVCIALPFISDAFDWGLSRHWIALGCCIALLLGIDVKLASMPDRGNTQIKFTFPMSEAEHLAGAVSKAKGWLGRDDIMLYDKEFDGTNFSFSAYANYHAWEIPALSKQLEGHGLNFRITQ